MQANLFKTLIILLILVCLFSFAEETPFTSFEEETSPQTIRRYTILRKSGQQVPFRWTHLHEILSRTPEILIQVGQMRSPLDDRLMIETAAYTHTNLPYIDEIIARELLAYVSRPELHPSRQLELFFNSARELELQALTHTLRKRVSTALEIDKNITRALNLLIHFELQNPNKNGYYLVNALINIIENQKLSLDEAKNSIVLDNYYKLLSYQLVYSSDPNEFKLVLERISKLKVEHIFAIFNSSNITTPRSLSEKGYSKFKFTLAHTLNFNLKRFESVDISSETLYLVTAPILNELETLAKKSELRVTQKELWKEIRIIAINALSMLELESSDFFSRSLSSRISKANSSIAEIDAQQEKESLTREATFNRPPSLDQQKIDIEKQLTFKMNTNARSSLYMKLGMTDFSFDTHTPISSNPANKILRISYRKPHQTQQHSAHEINPFMNDYANAIFVLETILKNPNHDGVLWRRNIPKSILNLRGLTITPYMNGLVILRIDPTLSCKQYF